MGKVGEKSAGETLNQLRDTYQQREQDLEVRHKDQVRELAETHQVEIARLRKENQDKLKTVQEEAASKLNQKDMHYQKEIEALRSMYAKQAIQNARGKKNSDEES